MRLRGFRSRTTRRGLLLGAAATAASAFTGRLRAQDRTPIVIGISADMSGNYVDTTGPGQIAAAEFAAEDFGGSVLGRPIAIKFADDQNKPDIAAATARR